ncbi:MAG: F0F1 ATP synthase subunit B [Actinobacteria bacterium]|nr:F0F1 ATP synthase subunit B [Actinomycetota bacterium]
MFNIIAAESEVNILRLPLDELIIGTLAFGIVFFALAKFAFPAISKTLETRADAIEGGLARAENSQAEAAAMLEQYRAQLADARGEAASIRVEAQAEKTVMIESARGEAAAAAASVTERAQAQIEAERSQAMASLRRDVSELALTLAGKVVGESLTDDARARASVDRFIADLEVEAAK